MFDFKELFNAFKEDTLMETILNEFSLMIEDGRWMFEVIGDSLLKGEDPEAHKEEIYSRDVRVNKTERSIRKKIVEHLTLNPRNDLGNCLIMFSAAKDAERLGDYCKNLLEVSELLKGRRYPEKWFPPIKDIHGRPMRVHLATSASEFKTSLLSLMCKLAIDAHSHTSNNARQ